MHASYTSATGPGRADGCTLYDVESWRWAIRSGSVQLSIVYPCASRATAVGRLSADAARGQHKACLRSNNRLRCRGPGRDATGSVWPREAEACRCRMGEAEEAAERPMEPCGEGEIPRLLEGLGDSLGTPWGPWAWGPGAWGPAAHDVSRHGRGSHHMRQANRCRRCRLVAFKQFVPPPPDGHPAAPTHLSISLLGPLI